MTNTTAVIEQKQTMPAVAGDAVAAAGMVAERADKSESMVMLEMIREMTMNPEFDPAKMQQIIDMRKDLFMENARIEYNRAMARVQARIEPVVRDAENKQTKSNYAKLETIVQKISPIYTSEGFALSFDQEACPIPEHSAKGWFRTRCEVTHSAGYTKSHHVDLPPDLTGLAGTTNKTAVHAVKSTISYARNMLTCMIFNIVQKNQDDDGNGAGGIIEPDITDWLTVIADSTSLEELKKNYTEAYNENKKHKGCVEKINRAKDIKKKELSR